MSVSKRDGEPIPPYTHEKDGTPVQETLSFEDMHTLSSDGENRHICLVNDGDKPMCFRGEPFCSDKCAKLQGKGPKEGYRGRNAG